MDRLTQRRPVPVGLLYSQSGFYGVVGREMLNGALLGIEEVNSWPDIDFRLEPLIADPGGGLRAYYDACEAMLTRHDARHVVGCYTSAARRQVLPLIEAAQALLWHPARYEGFESSDNVIYVGAAPNQHVIPLARHMLHNIARDVYCVGSNYIWTWETNRVLRDVASAAGGRVLAERTLPLGETGVDHIVEEILRLRPPAVFNTLVGESSYSFFRAYHHAGQRQSRHPLPPVLSCSLCEPELRLIGGPASAGHIACSTWFQSIDTQENYIFLDRYHARFGQGSSPSVDAEASYVCAMLLGRAMRAAGSAEVTAVRRQVYLDRFEAPQGPVQIDPENNHCYATPRIGRSTADGGFEILWQFDAPVRPDPYLVWLDQEVTLVDDRRPSVAGRHLRVVP